MIMDAAYGEVLETITHRLNVIDIIGSHLYGMTVPQFLGLGGVKHSVFTGHLEALEFGIGG